MKKLVWIDKEALFLLHALGLARFGGAPGVRDAGLLESALARARNTSLYEPKADVPSLAAAYAFGIAKNHPFVDGNKRAAFLCAGLFLELNGWRLETTPAEAISAMMALASGQIEEAQLAIWLKLHSTKV